MSVLWGGAPGTEVLGPGMLLGPDGAWTPPRRVTGPHVHGVEVPKGTAHPASRMLARWLFSPVTQPRTQHSAPARALGPRDWAVELALQRGQACVLSKWTHVQVGPLVSGCA